MALQLINLGTHEGDRTGDKGREGGLKINANFTELYAVKAQNNYTSITVSSYVITDDELNIGTNIFGVNYAGAVSITLPQNIDSGKIIVIKDESGLAATNNITITVG